MIPNGTAYDNFPPFANNGTKTPPGGSTESAKYALGMLPADTFPAEWANWLFHGATAGLTRLNSDTGSIKKEINNVLSNYNITPAANDNTQLMAAVRKIIAEAALAAHPVGSIYQNLTDSRNPAVYFGGGTWTPITDKFIAAIGNMLKNEAGGIVGNFSYSLTYANIPQHQHAMQHTHTIEHTHYVSISGSTISQSAVTTTTESATHTHQFGVGIAFADGDVIGIPNGDASLYTPQYTTPGGWVNTPAPGAGASIPLAVKGARSNVYRVMSLGDNTGIESATHTHQYEHGHNVSVSGNTNDASTPNSGNASREYTGYWGEPTVTAINTTPPYQAAYTWYRSA